MPSSISRAARGLAGATSASISELSTIIIRAVITWPFLFNGNWTEAYAKPSYKFADWLTVGGVFETAFNDFNNKYVLRVLRPGVWAGDAGHYFASGNAVITLPWHPVADVTLSINPEIGYEWYSSGVNANMGLISDTYWDVGLDINYKAITLDLRYWGTDANPGVAGTATANQCDPLSVQLAAPTSAATAS